MKLRREDLEVRCIQRGYAWDDVAACIVRDHGDGWLDVNVDHDAYPRAKTPIVHRSFESPVTIAPPAPGLGDMTASALAAVGITKKRVSALVGGPCGCDKRQAWLNKAGEKWLGLPPGSTGPAVD